MKLQTQAWNWSISLKTDSEHETVLKIETHFFLNWHRDGKLMLIETFTSIDWNWP